MIEIIKYLYLGNRLDAINASQNKTVDVILYLGQELPRELSHESKVPVFHVPLKDGHTHEISIHLVLGIIGYLTLDDKTLVACRAGISRSPTIITAFLSAYEAWSFKKAFNHVKKLHPSFIPNIDFFKVVEKVTKEYWEKKT